jgi:hypothetical protein
MSAKEEGKIITLLEVTIFEHFLAKRVTLQKCKSAKVWGKNLSIASSNWLIDTTGTGS